MPQQPKAYVIKQHVGEFMTFAENGRFGPDCGVPLYFAPKRISVDTLSKMWQESGEDWRLFADAIQLELGAV